MFMCLLFFICLPKVLGIYQLSFSNRMGRPALTKKEIDRIKRLKNEGKKIVEITKIVKRHRNTVSLALKATEVENQGQKTIHRRIGKSQNNEPDLPPGYIFYKRIKLSLLDNARKKLGVSISNRRKNSIFFACCKKKAGSPNCSFKAMYLNGSIYTKSKHSGHILSDIGGNILIQI